MKRYILKISLQHKNMYVENYSMNKEGNKLTTFISHAKIFTAQQINLIEDCITPSDFDIVTPLELVEVFVNEQ
jgi:hypothetical protein